MPKLCRSQITFSEFYLKIMKIVSYRTTTENNKDEVRIVKSITYSPLNPMPCRIAACVDRNPQGSVLTNLFGSRIPRAARETDLYVSNTTLFSEYPTGCAS